MIFKAEQQTLPTVRLLKKTKKKSQANWVNGRWSIIGLFLVTVIASLFFYFQTEIPRLWQKITSPAVISTLPGKFDPSLILTEIEILTKDLRGTYGVYVYRLEDQIEYGFRQDDIFPAASLIKLPVMLTVYQEAEKGNLNLDDYRQQIEAMGKRSDNATFNQIVKILGEERIQKTIDDLGMKKTSFVKNNTTPEDVGLFFQKFYSEGMISGGHQKEFLDYLTNTEFEDRIPAGVPEEVRVTHKIGTEVGSFSDAGIVFAQKPFILVIISKEARESEANEVLPKIAAAVWKFENEQ